MPLIKNYGFRIAFPPVYWQGPYKRLTEPELLGDEGLMLTGNLKNPLPFPKSSLSKPKANTQTQGGERVGFFKLLLPGNSLESASTISKRSGNSQPFTYFRFLCKIPLLPLFVRNTGLAEPLTATNLSDAAPLCLFHSLSIL